MPWCRAMQLDGASGYGRVPDNSTAACLVLGTLTVISESVSVGRRVRPGQLVATQEVFPVAGFGEAKRDPSWRYKAESV